MQLYQSFSEVIATHLCHEIEAPVVVRLLSDPQNIPSFVSIIKQAFQQSLTPTQFKNIYRFCSIFAPQLPPATISSLLESLSFLASSSKVAHVTKSLELISSLIPNNPPQLTLPPDLLDFTLEALYDGYLTAIKILGKLNYTDHLIEFAPSIPFDSPTHLDLIPYIGNSMTYLTHPISEFRKLACDLFEPEEEFVDEVYSIQHCFGEVFIKPRVYSSVYSPILINGYLSEDDLAQLNIANFEGDLIPIVENVFSEFNLDNFNIFEFVNFVNIILPNFDSFGVNVVLQNLKNKVFPIINSFNEPKQLLYFTKLFCSKLISEDVELITQLKEVIYKLLPTNSLELQLISLIYLIPFEDNIKDIWANTVSEIDFDDLSELQSLLIVTFVRDYARVKKELILEESVLLNILHPHFIMNNLICDLLVLLNLQHEVEFLSFMTLNSVPQQLTEPIPFFKDYLFVKHKDLNQFLFSYLNSRKNIIADLFELICNQIDGENCLVLRNLFNYLPLLTDIDAESYSNCVAILFKSLFDSFELIGKEVFLSILKELKIKSIDYDLKTQLVKKLGSFGLNKTDLGSVDKVLNSVFE
ncbi:hypothetical protein P9112_001813 [Eukaryota sp. TZLM1-RC]